MAFKYVVNAGQYQDTDSGRFINQDRLEELLAEETGRLRARLRGHARVYQRGNIDIPEFQLRMAESIKRAHLRIAELAVGGRSQMTPAVFGRIGRTLRDEYGHLANFGTALEEGMSDRMLLHRAGSYARAIEITFSRTWLYSSQIAGFDLFMRSLDAGADHCPSCPRYDTGGQWVGADEIVPKGVRCECQNNCRCRVVRRRSFSQVVRDLNNGATVQQAG
jgi:hypothetical protein